MKFAMYDATGRITRTVTMPPDMDPVAFAGESFIPVADDVNDFTHRVEGGAAVPGPVPAPVVVGYNFNYAGKRVAVDDAERIRMNGITGVVMLTGALPTGWPGSWPAADGTTIPIPDVPAWRDFFVAMVSQVV